MKMTRPLALTVLFLGTVSVLNLAWAQQPRIRRTNLQRHALSVPGREAIQVRVDLAPGTAFGRHRHPGEELVYVLEGSLQYALDGKPPVTLKAGEVLFIPAGTVHSAKNVGSVNAAELATYIVKKGKPLIVPFR